MRENQLFRQLDEILQIESAARRLCSRVKKNIAC
jgi:hypothetical protein